MQPKHNEYFEGILQLRNIDDDILEFAIKLIEKKENGFNKGDIMVLMGKDIENLKIGDVIVFRSNRKDPIIHRVVKITEEDGNLYFQTKGDNNKDSIKTSQLDETNITEREIIGKAVLRIPLLGYIKIAFVEFLKLIGII